MKFTKRTFIKSLLAAPVGLQASVGNSSSTQAPDVQWGDLRICFGSCNYQNASQNHWATIAQQKPDFWFWLGDNIYGDTENPAELKTHYRRQLEGPYDEFQSAFSIEGIWDDHDYGLDNSDRNHPTKVQSQKLFLDFLGVSQDDERREKEGVYYSKTFMIGDVSIKTYFLDCRYFKDPKKQKGASLLGAKQWCWLEDEMANSDAQVNIFVTPIGFLLNRLFVTEDWAEYRDERDKLMELISSYDLSGSFFLSGDKHFAAAIKRNYARGGLGKVKYFEFQSSGLTHTVPKSQMAVIKRFYGRKNVVGTKNFGQIDFKCTDDSLEMKWTAHSLTDTSKNIARHFKLVSGIWKLI
jgi:alkaline phosphatase D